MNSILKTDPAVFAVSDTYQIMVPVKCECLMWVKVGDKEFYDDSNGILRSKVTTHRITVPAKDLDNAEKYTLCSRKIIERKPYFSEVEDIVEKTYTFRPVPENNCRTYHIADAHNRVTEPIEALKLYEEKFGEIDFLIMNGDIPDHSGKIENFDNIYRIAALATKGEKPTVFSRGNHDTRGIFAENIADHTPTDNGNSYFTFKLGNIFGIVLDCGEDKPDDHEAYGHTICCHDFRMRETKFLENLMKEKEFENEKYKTRMVISHVPFTKRQKPPFNIEEDTYTNWAKILKENFHPDVMLCGHMHGDFVLSRVGSEDDNFGQPCPVIIASHNVREECGHMGCGIEFSTDGIFVTETESGHGISDTIKI